MPTTDLSIITIGYASQETLPNLLKSIHRQTDCSIEFIYVENSSLLSSTTIVKTYYPNAIIIEPEDNLGFSKGCNLAAQQAKGEYLLFLNPDCEIKTEKTFSTMLEFMHKNRDVGICGPLFINETGQRVPGAHSSYFAEQYAPNDFSSLPGTICWVSGAALMISKQLFEIINGFDDRYFMYSEDIDICLMARKAGFLIAEVANTQIMHLREASSKQAWTDSESKFRVELALGIFTEKHYHPKQHKRLWKRARFKKLIGVIKNYFFRYHTRFQHDLTIFKASQNILRQLKSNVSG